MTYQEADLRHIADAGNIDFAIVGAARQRFEAAALWYRLDCESPKRISPSKMVRRLDRVARCARALLKALGIEHPAAAFDGPQDPALLIALASIDGGSEANVVRAAERVGRLAEMLDAAKAASQLDLMAGAALADVREIGAMTVQPGHQGDVPLNDWIAAMMVIYRDLTGREPATSVGAPDRPNEGIAGGPLIRFLAAAGKPLGAKKKPDAWRARTRLILDQASDSD